MATDARTRFSGRVEYYVKYRPHYPAAMFDHLRRRCGLGPKCLVADIGSGTGILVGPMLDLGARVFAVEPNAEMRAAIVREHGERERFESRAGTAEQTGLPNASVDIITVGSAFHWFDHKACRKEFTRILRPGGWLAIAGNKKDKESPLGKRLRAIMDRYVPDDHPMRRSQEEREAAVAKFFAPAKPECVAFEHVRRYDEAAIVGYLLSHSNLPLPNDPRYETLKEDVSVWFKEFSVNGFISLTFKAELELGVIP